MKYNPDKPARRSPRLTGYDYSQNGAYFVTLCTEHRECLFGDIVDDRMRLNAYGEIAQVYWSDLVNHYQNIELDEFIVMPNHVHAILFIVDVDSWTGNIVGEGLKPSPTKKRHGLPEIIRGFKTFSARRINELRVMPSTPVWQRSYYDHIIRDEVSLNRIRQYILSNPSQWQLDGENPIRSAPG